VWNNVASEVRNPEVLIIDDEIQVRRLLRITLEASGFEVRDCSSGQLGLDEIAFRRPDIVILDLGLPGMSGVEVLKRLREWSKVPVLILSVLGHEDDKVGALDAGADDYLTKPFNGRELVARLKVMMRHSQPDDGISILRFGPNEIDFTRKEVTRSGEPVALTSKEYALLQVLASHRGKVVTRRQVLREVWGPSAEDKSHYLRVYLERLRRKLEDDPGKPRYLRTEQGVGYRFVGD
jgi:two-component system KDP operon response regulator KdpE